MQIRTFTPRAPLHKIRSACPRWTITKGGQAAGSPPAVLLRESYREAGKVKNRTLANLSAWPEAKVDALSRVLKGQPPPAADLDGAFEITRSLPHGHVAAVLGALRDLGLAELIDPVPSRHRDLVTAMTVAQVIDPGSKLAIARGLAGPDRFELPGQDPAPGVAR